MKKLKRVLTLLVAVSLMAAVVLTGCGENKTENEGTSTADNETSSAPEATVEPEVKKDPVTIVWYGTGDDQTNPKPVYDKVNEILLDKYNILLDFKTYPFGTYNEKMNMIISSGEKYDLCFTTESWLNKYPQQVARDAFLALDDYLPNYPKLLEVFPDKLLQQMRENGKIYAIPNYQIAFSQWGLFFRKDLIEESGFDYLSIKTYMDAEPFWKWVVENRPEYFPAKESWQSQLVDTDHQWVDVAYDAIYNRDDTTRTLIMMDDKAKSMAAKRGAWYMGTRNRDMWLKGYLRKDSPTVVDQAPDQAAGRYASFHNTVKPGGEAEVSAKYGAEYVQVALEKPMSTQRSSRSAMTAVGSLTDHPEDAIRMLEIVNTDAEIMNLLNFGIEGTNYELEGGKVKKIEGSGYFYNTAWALGNQFIAKLMVGQQDGIWEETDRLNREAEYSPVNGFSFNNTNVTNEIANVQAVRKEFYRWEYMDNYEERYDQTIAKLEEAGRSKILAEVQKQLDEWFAAQK